MSEKLEDGEQYRGPCGVLKDSAWINSDSIPPDRDTVVEIEAVIRRRVVRFKDGEKKGYGSLKFKGKEKELGLCATHLKTLKALFGSDTSAWYGKKIALFVDPDVQAFGQRVSAVRIRAKVPDANAKPKQPDLTGADA